MIQTKKHRIQAYLNSIDEDKKTAFDVLLEHYLNGLLRRNLIGSGLSRVQISIDFLEDYKCINVSGKYGKYYVDLIIEQTEFSIGCDLDEPDDHIYYPLESAEFLYSTFHSTIHSL